MLRVGSARRWPGRSPRLLGPAVRSGACQRGRPPGPPGPTTGARSPRSDDPCARGLRPVARSPGRWLRRCSAAWCCRWPAGRRQRQPRRGNGADARAPDHCATGRQRPAGRGRTPGRRHRPGHRGGTRLPSTFRPGCWCRTSPTSPWTASAWCSRVHERATSRSGLRAALAAAPPASREGDPSSCSRWTRSSRWPGGSQQLEVALDAEEAGLFASDERRHRPPGGDLARPRACRSSTRCAPPWSAVARSRGPAHCRRWPWRRWTAPHPTSTDEPGPQALLPGGPAGPRPARAGDGPPGIATVAPAAHAVEDLQRPRGRARCPARPTCSPACRRWSPARPPASSRRPYALADVPALATTRPPPTTSRRRRIVAGRQRLVDLVGAAPDAAHLLGPTRRRRSLDLAPADVLHGGLGRDAPAPTWRPTRAPTSPRHCGQPQAARAGAGRPDGRPLDHRPARPGPPAPTAGRSMHTASWSRPPSPSPRHPAARGASLAVIPPLGWEAPGRLPDELYRPTRRRAVAAARRPGHRRRAQQRGRHPGTPPDTVSPDRTPPAVAGRDVAAAPRWARRSAVSNLDERPDVVPRGDDLLRAMTLWPLDPPTNDPRHPGRRSTPPSATPSVEVRSSRARPS